MKGSTPVIRRCTSSSQNLLTISANLVALAVMIAGLTLVQGGRAAASVTSIGLLILAASSAYSWWLGRSRNERSTR
jgi:hypothetical protein